jgi:hypothetical protein
MDDDFFGFTEEEYAEEEKRQAEEQKRKAEEAEHAEAGGPSAKKIRVDQPKWPSRRSTHRPSTKVRAGAASPSHQPEFQPNRRHTYQPTPLETIESSRLLEEDEAHDEAQTPTDSNAANPDPGSDIPGEYRVPGSLPYSSSSLCPPTIPHWTSMGVIPNPPATIEVCSSPPFSPTEISRSPGFIPNPHGTFEVPYSSPPPSSPSSSPQAASQQRIAQSNFFPPSNTNIFQQVLDSDFRPRYENGGSYNPTPQERAEAKRDPRFSRFNSMSNALFIAQENYHRRVQEYYETNPHMRPTPGTISNRTEDPTNSSLLGCSQISGEDDLLPPHSTGEIIRNPTGSNGTSIPLMSDPLDEPPDVVVNFNPDGTLADDQVAAAVSDSDDESPLTRARTKAEQFKPKTPSRLREAHRSSMNRSSPFSQTAITPIVFDRQEPSNHPAPENQEFFNTLEDIEKYADADWLYRQCPSGDLRQLKWPPKISLIDQIRSHGVNLTEEIALADEVWNDPVQRQIDLNAMRTVLATSMSKPFGVPVDMSAWDSRPGNRLD